MENRKYKTGDTCPIAGCTGRFKVYKSRRLNGIVTRYHACDKCKHKPEFNKQYVPEEFVPRRSPPSGSV